MRKKKKKIKEKTRTTTTSKPKPSNSELLGFKYFILVLPKHPKEIIE